jgi:nucleoside-diphosphate-sugar epimerase
MKALIIGSEGNIGLPLVARLRARGWEVLETDIKPAWRPGYMMADINHPVDLLPAFDWKPDVVFLLSAIVSRVTCEQASAVTMATNLAGVNNVIQLVKRCGAHLVFFSTSEVYGPECESMDEALTDPKPNNRYGLSKLLGEKLVEYEVRTNQLSAVSLRPFMMYDEEEDLGDHRSAMIRFAYNLSLGKPIEVHAGSARGWLHVSDAVRAIEAAAGARHNYAVINIGHPDIRPISELADTICAKLGADTALVRHVSFPERMTPVKRPVLKRQEDILGVVPEVGFEEGVSRVCSRIVQRVAELRKVGIHL